MTFRKMNKQWAGETCSYKNCRLPASQATMHGPTTCRDEGRAVVVVWFLLLD